MNQILRNQQKQNINNSQRKHKIYGLDYNGTNKLHINRGIKRFAILILFFGIFIMAKGIYGIATTAPKERDKTVELRSERKGSKIILKATANNPMRNINYRWNDGESIVIEGNNRNNIDQTITIPYGQNTLKIVITDNFGSKSEYEAKFERDSYDSQEPVIELKQDERDRRKLLANIKDETEINYITYEWAEYRNKNVDDDNSEVKNLEITKNGEIVKVRVEPGKKDVEVSLDIPAGNHILILTAYDTAENQTVLKQAVQGIVIPELSLSFDDGKLKINAKDEFGLKTLKIDTDGNINDAGDSIIGQKDIDAILEIGKEKHKSIVTVENLQGQKTTKEIETGR